MFDELTTQNWSSSRTLFTPQFCFRLAQECQNLFQQGQLQPAHIGHGATKLQNAEIRGDSTLWFDEISASPLQKIFLKHLSTLLERLNRSFYLSLKRYEAHFALYPPGAGYDKHIDNHRGSGARKITFILYLNESWQKGNGGELSLYDPTEENNMITQIEPTLGTFVLFRSELFPHQVEKCFKPRLSITGWLRDDAL